MANITNCEENCNETSVSNREVIYTVLSWVLVILLAAVLSGKCR